MLNVNDILETIKMIDEEYLDVRTITMGISLLDLISSVSSGIFPTNTTRDFLLLV